ncbi:MAG: SDR family oxidoreductase [Pseudomonadota bacterium]
MQRVAVVTGGSKGIGRCLAQALLEVGHDVMITASRDVAALDATARDLGDTFGHDRVVAMRADAADVHDAKRVVAETVERFGRLDILVNNAGRGPREISEQFHTNPPKFWEADPDRWAAIVRTNLVGPFAMARAVVPGMLASGWGRIIGVSTSRATMIRQGFAPYGPTKAALDTMTRIMAQDLEGTGVTANVILPGGATDTGFIPEEGRHGHYLNLLAPDVMNAALVWLVSEAANAVNGARFVGNRWDPEDPMACREDKGEEPAIL